MTWTTLPRSEFGSLAAIKSGEGKPALLLHGVGLRAEAWNAAIAGLQHAFRIIAPDMPGHSASEFLGGLTRIAHYTDCVAGGLAEPTHVAGHSMGALIALDLAVRYPAKVRTVCALNAIYRRRPEAASAVCERAAEIDVDKPVDPSAALARWFGSNASPERDACAAWLSTINPLAYKSAYTAFAEGDAPPDASLRNISCPALFITGDGDPNSTADMTRALAELIPGGQAVIIENAAHMLPMTHPNRVNALLSKFWTENNA